MNPTSLFMGGLSGEMASDPKLCDKRGLQAQGIDRVKCRRAPAQKSKPKSGN